MKKEKAIQVLTALLMASALAGCGVKNGENSSGEGNSQAVSQETSSQDDLAQEILLKDVEVEKYVTLGEYKGIKVNAASPEVDLAMRDEYVERLYQDPFIYGYATGVMIEDGITDRAVKEGDTINIDYEGKKDGVAFAGGASKGAYLIIGSGQFIDGFEDGLVGAMPGTTVDLELTFPETYGNTELAGHSVVFTVTVNYIMPEGMHEAIIALLEIENVTTREELEQYVYDFLLENEQQAYEAEIQNLVLATFMQNCTFEELPEELVSQYENRFRENITTGASYLGMDGDMYLLQYYNYYGGMEQFIDEYAKEAVKQDLALQAVINKENITVDDEELNEILLEQAQMYGFTTVEEYIGDVSLEILRSDYLINKAYDFLMENAEVIN